MTTVNLFHAKTHLSKLVDQIASGEESEVVISRNGKPVARMVPIKQNKDISCRIGIAEGEFTVPENIDSANEEVAKLFYQNSDGTAPQGIHDIEVK
ncbi:type II toxin-antitoxin system Phd/YefM family antitoxin [Methyloglobulus sp.]|uniref:type II toxin-antitoxin system Phd/YefM family antitoxin n=1 Tax=Methyloglobulus sp. TaxID=2518622 RepID=UPI0032B7894D